MYKKEEFKEAHSFYLKAMEAHKTNYDARYRKGLCQIALQDYLGAITDFTNVIETKSDFIDAYLYRANAHLALGTVDQIEFAVKDYTEVIEKQFSGMPVLIRGYCYYLLRKEELALQDWRRAKELGLVQHEESDWKKDYDSI